MPGLEQLSAQPAAVVEGAKPPMYPDPLLAVSDHCPLVAEIEF